jgi:hypothetical protein
MSIIARIAPKATPAPVKTTTVLFDATRARQARRAFGAGILAYVPSDGRKPYTAGDARWWAETSNQAPPKPLSARQKAILAEMAHMEQMAQESAWQDAYERGCNGL